MSLPGRLSAILRSEVVRNFLSYGVGAAFLSGISFFLIPVYTRVIPPEQYGVLELINTGIAILSTILPLGIAQAYFLEYYHHSPAERPKLLMNCSLLYLLIGTPVILLLLVFTGSINQSLFQSQASVFLIAAALVTAYLRFCQTMFVTTLRMARKALPLVSFQVLMGLLVAGANIYLVYYRRLGIEAIVGVNLAAAGATLLTAMAFYGVKVGKIRFDLTWGKARGYFLLGLPLLPAAAAVWVLNAADRWILTAYGYQDELGLYSLAYKFGALYSLVVVAPFTAAYQPKVFASYRENLEATERRNLRVLRVYLAVFLSAVTLLFLMGRPVFHVLVGPQYHEAYGYILPIVLGYVMVGATSVALNFPLYQKKSAAVALVNGAGAVFNVAANFFLIKSYGAWAAAIVTPVSFTLTFALALRLRGRLWSEVTEGIGAEREDA